MKRLSAREALLTILDAVDYTSGACAIGEMVGAVLSKEMIVLARDALEETGSLGRQIEIHAERLENAAQKGLDKHTTHRVCMEVCEELRRLVTDNPQFGDLPGSAMRPYSFERATSLLRDIMLDLSILAGDIASTAAWQDVAGTLMVNLSVLTRLIYSARAGNTVGSVVFPSPADLTGR